MFRKVSGAKVDSLVVDSGIPLAARIARTYLQSALQSRSASSSSRRRQISLSVKVSSWVSAPRGVLQRNYAKTNSCCVHTAIFHRYHLDSLYSKRGYIVR